MDGSPRPCKRRKLELSKPITDIRPLPPGVLLLSLQSFLAHPPTHRNYTSSLFLTLFALRKCLSLSGLDYFTECRVWTSLAEVGFRIGLGEPAIVGEVEKAITKALFIINRHPSLRAYKPRLTCLSAQLAAFQNNTKFAQNSVKKLITDFLEPSDPPHVSYMSHLAYFASLSADARDSTSMTHSKALGAVGDLLEIAIGNKHSEIVSLAMVLELHELVRNGIWKKVSEVLGKVEEQLCIAAPIEAATKSSCPSTPTKSEPNASCVIGSTNLQKVLIVHVLVIGTLFYTYIGDGANAQSRMKKLHDMLDGGALDAFGKAGIVKVDFPDSPSSSLEIQVTHPRVIFSLGFLVSSTAKRDPVGRKPKRRLFAQEGVMTVDKELRMEPSFPLWASLFDVQEFQERMHRLKADMLCELIGVAISRSEFSDAEREICRVIAHTRTYGLFASYSARITLHQAHLAHALCQTERALKCYEVASFLSRRRTQVPSKEARAACVSQGEDEGSEDSWLNVSARAGRLWLRIGIINSTVDDMQREMEMEELRREGKSIVKECEGLGAALQTVGAVLAACLSKEFLVAKTHLRTALNLSTTAQDNHLRALILALIAAQYVHTSAEHTETILITAEQLTAGIGSQPKGTLSQEKAINQKTGPTETSIVAGNAHLRLWIGERSLELKRRAGDEESALQQIRVNKKLEQAVENLKKRLSQTS